IDSQPGESAALYHRVVVWHWTGGGLSQRALRCFGISVNCFLGVVLAPESKDAGLSNRHFCCRRSNAYGEFEYCAISNVVRVGGFHSLALENLVRPGHD